MAPIKQVEVAAYTVPTDSPESDGTLEWDKTTMVVVKITAGGQQGLGYTYADVATAHFIREHLNSRIQDRDVMEGPRLWADMLHAIRNLGKPGVSSMAVSAVDTAVWDLK